MSGFSAPGPIGPAGAAVSTIATRVGTPISNSTVVRHPDGTRGTRTVIAHSTANPILSPDQVVAPSTSCSRTAPGGGHPCARTGSVSLTQRFEVPLRTNRGPRRRRQLREFSARPRVHQKWTPTPPSNLRHCSEFGGSFIHEKPLSSAERQMVRLTAANAGRFCRRKGTISATICSS